MSNPLLAKVKLPGRIFQLPSKGVFYEGHLSHVLGPNVKNGEIEVKPLSALAEMKLRSPDLLYSGKAISEICHECIPDILLPEKLLSKDIDAIFCFLRITTYGSSMRVKSIHECQGRQVHEYPIDIESIIMNANNDILDNVIDLYTMKLSNEQVVILKPVTFDEALETTHLQQDIEKKLMLGQQDQALIEELMIKDLMAVIKTVDGVEDKLHISEWVRSLPRKFFNEIYDRAKSINEWGYDLNVNITCKDCGEVYKHDLELNPVNFFSG